MPKKPKPSVADQFSDKEMDQIKRYGQALGGKPTPFDEEVEEHLTGMEANAKKMRAAQTGGGDQSLGPSDMDEAAVKQGQALSKQADTQAAAQAQQAQGAQAPVNAPAAPSGPQGTTTVFPAQKGAVGGPGNAAAPSQTPPPPAQPPPGGEEDESDPATQFPP